jgi:hypothetical protein
MKTFIQLFIITLFLDVSSLTAFSQTAIPFDSALKDVGVAVSPSHLNFNVKPGESKTIEVKVTNETKSCNS